MGMALAVLIGREIGRARTLAATTFIRVCAGCHNDFAVPYARRTATRCDGCAVGAGKATLALPSPPETRGDPEREARERDRTARRLLRDALGEPE